MSVPLCLYCKKQVYETDALEAPKAVVFCDTKCFWRYVGEHV